MSLPSREAWIEIFAIRSMEFALVLSLPSREAWIEIHLLGRQFKCSIVASLAGSVD